MWKQASLLWVLSIFQLNLAWSQVQITLKPIKDKVTKVIPSSASRGPSSTTKKMKKTVINSNVSKNGTSEIEKKEKGTLEKGALSKPLPTDLNAELAASKETTRTTSENLRPEELRPANKKKRKMQRIISGPNESIEVPDSVDWDHHKTRQIEAGKELNEKINSEMGRTKIDD